jgi:hypothetical protein
MGAHTSIELVLTVDCTSTVCLNGKAVGQTANAHRHALLFLLPLRRYVPSDLKGWGSRRQYRFPARQHLVEGSNAVQVVICSAVSKAAARAAAYPYPVPYVQVSMQAHASHHACVAAACAALLSWPDAHVQIPRIIPHYNFLRKPACDSGWDWGPGFAPSGLNAVALVGHSCAEILGGRANYLACSRAVRERAMLA